MRAWPVAAVLCLITCTAPVRADEEAPVPALGEAELLATSEAQFPAILEALARRRVAEGATIEALGAFDLVFDADGFSRVTGFYDGSVVSGVSRQRLQPFGANVYAGYRLSDGDFPIYEDEYFTNAGGEITVGLLFSLLRDREIDDARFELRDSRLSLEVAEQDLLLTKIGVQRRARVAYWRWVTAGRKLSVYEDLLRIALERESGLEQQVRRGARARIFLVENSQNITRRRTLTTAAERDFRLAANDLSLFYRGSGGEPIVPDRSRLPPMREPDAGAVPPAPTELDATDALLRRPELLKLRTTIDRVRNRIALAENDLKPRLDLNVAVDHDMGPIAEGGPSRDSTDTKVGFTFTVPMQRRAARGQLYSAEAELSALRQEQRRVQDQIEIEVSNILVSLDTAEALLGLAEEQVSQTEQMRDAERRRFESGASDFFLVNIREETAADARVLFHEARLDREVALADYYAATVDLLRLGIRE